MVKFNNKVSKYTRTTSVVPDIRYRRPPATSPLAGKPTSPPGRIVDRFLEGLMNQRLLSLDPKTYKNAAVYFHVSDESMMGPLQALPKKAEEMELEVRNGYTLLLDDERGPNHYELHDETHDCFVATTNAGARKVIELYGCPKIMLLDYYLRGENTSSFVKWFCEWLSEEKSRMHPEFRFTCHSGDTSMRQVIRRMFAGHFEMYPR